MTKTIETKIRKITPWMFADTNERFSHLEIYFNNQGTYSYRGTRGTKQQIIDQLGFDDSKSFESNLNSLIGKKVSITKDTQTGWICDMKIAKPARSKAHTWLSFTKETNTPEYC